MNREVVVDSDGADPAGLDAGNGESGDRLARLRRQLSFGNIGAIYIFIIVVIVFSIWAPDTFPTWTTVKTVINQNAVAGIIALSLVVPLSAGVYDLSIGAVMGLTSIFCAWLMVKHGVAIAPAIALTIALGAVLGGINATLVVIIGIPSFIATLATGSLMTAAIALIAKYEAITGPELSNPSFSHIATLGIIAGIGSAAVIMFAVSIGLWVFQERTASGRRMLATGFNPAAARLTGVHTERLQFIGLMISATVAAIAGVLITSQLQAGSPEVGSPYLLGAFAAAFLGAAQFKGGRFNAWGTLIAVLVLGTGTAGLVLVGAEPWASEMFVGVVLLGSLGLTAYERTRGTRRLISQSRRRNRDRAAAKAVAADAPGT
jgi:ribose transport system permease protein